MLTKWNEKEKGMVKDKFFSVKEELDISVEDGPLEGLLSSAHEDLPTHPLPGEESTITTANGPGKCEEFYGLQISRIVVRDEN